MIHASRVRVRVCDLTVGNRMGRALVEPSSQTSLLKGAPAEYYKTPLPRYDLRPYAL